MFPAASHICPSGGVTLQTYLFALHAHVQGGKGKATSQPKQVQKQKHCRGCDSAARRAWPDASQSRVPMQTMYRCDSL